MKCLFVMPALHFGGAERVTSVLANEWVKQGVNVRILLVESDETSCYPLADNVVEEKHKLDRRSKVQLFALSEKKLRSGSQTQLSVSTMLYVDLPQLP